MYVHGLCHPVFQGRKLSCFFLRNLFHNLMTPFLVIIIVPLSFGVSYSWVNNHNEIFSNTHSIDFFKKYLRIRLVYSAIKENQYNKSSLVPNWLRDDPNTMFF